MIEDVRVSRVSGAKMMSRRADGWICTICGWEFEERPEKFCPNCGWSDEWIRELTQAGKGEKPEKPKP